MTRAHPAMRCSALAFASVLSAVFTLSLAESARADVQHVVAKGHTVDAIAHRYHVSVKAILDANHLKDGNHLKVGETLTIPGVKADEKSKAGAAAGKGGKKDEKHPPNYASRPKTPGLIHATRLATNESFVIRANTHRGKQTPAAEKQMEQMLRSAGGLSHPIDPRVLALLGVVSNHFGGRKIEVISGFRPYAPTQHTAHSNHNVGKAIDFRVVGVPNEVVRDFCRTLHNTGCGYYPNSTFVHMDTRTSSAFWIDYSRPGETPRYDSPNANPDEGTSDVGEEARVPPPSQDEDGLPEVEDVAPSAPAAPAAPSAAPPVVAPPGSNGDTP